MSTDRALHKAGPAREKALDPVLYGEQEIYSNLWRLDILSIYGEQVSKICRLVVFVYILGISTYIQSRCKLTSPIYTICIRVVYIWGVYSMK